MTTVARNALSVTDIMSRNLSELNATGKIPPQAVELEEVVLGAILIEKTALIKVVDFLKFECFYKQSHELIYRAILCLFDKSEPIDILTVTQQLKTMGQLEMAGGAYFISQLTNRVASAENIEFHARIILQKYMLRECIRLSAEAIKSAYDDSTDVFSLFDKMLSNTGALMQGVMKKTEIGSTAILTDLMNHLDAVAQSDNGITGVPTNLTMVNSKTRGFQDSDLIIVAGRPGAGKTSYVKNIIKGCINGLQKGVLFFSFEMSTRQILKRFLSEDVNIPANHFNSKEFLKSTDHNEINKHIRSYMGKDGKDLLFIDDSSSMTINELRARAKLICSKNNIKLIVVDYLQKVTGEGQNRTTQVGNVSSGLKGLAKDLDIPVVALSQLSRQVENRKNGKTGSTVGKPELSDLRDSGEIEQDADMVMFLHRPEYYGIAELEDGSSAHQVAYVDIAKNRNGELASIKLRFVANLTKFEDWSDNVPITTTSEPYNPNAGISNNTDFIAPIKRDPLAEDPF